jgi:hypothetical protein
MAPLYFLLTNSSGFSTFIQTLGRSMENQEFNATQLPFNRLIRLRESENPEYILKLESSEDYQDNLQSVHASALFALAEATSGQYLINEFSNNAGALLPVIRQVTAKYKKTARGCIYSKAALDGFWKDEVVEQLKQKSRIGITVNVNLYDEQGVNVMQADVQWYLTRQ